jgi:signal peptidase
MVKIIRKIIDVLLIITIVFLAGYYILRLSGKAEIYNVVTGSMEDHIHVGDYILIYRKNDYQIGDVVTFKEKDSMITHRIIREENGYFITKGDANNTEDEKISKDKIVGKAILIGGLLNIVINYKYAIIGVLLSMYLIGWIIDDLTKKKENTKNE